MSLLIGVAAGTITAGAYILIRELVASGWFRKPLPPKALWLVLGVLIVAVLVDVPA